MSTNQAPQNDESQNVARIDWDGEGLPPVGTVCEVQEPKGLEEGDWSTCVILAWDGSCAVFKVTSGTYPNMYDALVSFAFRPIRTPEQIAADDREKAIDDIASMIGRGSFSEDAARIYDEGYRKLE